MPNPIRDLKQLPWGQTLRTAASVVTGAVLLEWAIEQSTSLFPVLASSFEFLFQSNLSVLTLCASGILLGTATTELWCYQQRSLTPRPAILWTLIGSLILALIARWLIGIIALLISATFIPQALLTVPNMVVLLGIIVGTFRRQWM